MFSTIIRSKTTYFLVTFYCLLLLWWLRLNILDIKGTSEVYLFGFLYSAIALIGGISGILVSRVWGTYRSAMGRGILFFSCGLLGEFFGQGVWSYYNIIAKIEVPYPSIADIGYFSIIPLYAIGILYLAKASNAKYNLKTIKGKALVVIIPILMVAISYFLFLKNLAFDISDPIRTFLDFGYPFGEAITISIALITLGLSTGVLGGHMRSRILYLIFALGFQYFTDYTFLYMTANGTYYNGGVVDMLYTTSFLIMSLGLLSFREYE